MSIWNDDVMDWAAALTYYAVLALFPVLLVILPVIGLTMPKTAPEVIDRMTGVGPATHQQADQHDRRDDDAGGRAPHRPVRADVVDRVQGPAKDAQVTAARPQRAHDTEERQHPCR
ncbi:YhjD/YihY/BrkB family envelope integrity protein [Streptomyces puniciscabiei]|uniref:YhjD/YihY/BrkB family envelope integrity protein n=1 Tax=Streptomyces puniciscabiei TaxID=164348 RepID=UPI003794BCE4